MYATFQKCQKIFIAGAVGVGKTTYLECFRRNIQENHPEITLHVIPEYIDGDEDGPVMLQKFINRELDNFGFQMYILNFYEKYINSILKDVKEDDVIIFERLPDEGVACFANITYHEQGLSKLQMKELFNKVLELDVKYGLPTLFNLNLHQHTFITLKTIDKDTFTEEALMILKALKKHVIIGLYNSPEVCYHRVLERSRDCESAYTYSNIERFVRIYANIYRNILASINITIDSLPALFNAIV